MPPSDPRLLLRSLLLLACAGLAACSLRAEEVVVPAGRYSVGSDAEERALGYALSPPAVEAAGWYDAWEQGPHTVDLARFAIDRAPVTQGEYADFVRAHEWREPHVSPTDWEAQGFPVHGYREITPYLWKGGLPDPVRFDHPVVLVGRDDAAAYCAARGARLPTELEWEAACRGKGGRTFPWGDAWIEGGAHVGAKGTAPINSFPAGGTPDGILDLAGNVFEWTSSDGGDGETGGAVLRGCAWDDAPGSCRCAFRHLRPAESRHVLIGFRCAREPDESADPADVATR